MDMPVQVQGGLEDPVEPGESFDTHVRPVIQIVNLPGRRVGHKHIQVAPAAHLVDQQPGHQTQYHAPHLCLAVLVRPVIILETSINPGQQQALADQGVDPTTLLHGTGNGAAPGPAPNADTTQQQPDYGMDFVRSLGFIPATAGSNTKAGTSSLSKFIDMGSSVVGGLIDTGVNLGNMAISAAIAAGLVDEYQLFLAPVVVGGGLPVFARGAGQDLQLLGERRFDNGFVYLRYAPRD